MRVTIVSRVLIALAVLVAPLQSQTQPDFSGIWTLDPASATDVPATMSVTQVIVRANVRGEPIAPFFRQIVIVRGGRTESYDIGVGGGSVSATVHGSQPVRRSHHSVVWEDQVLTIESGTYTGTAVETGEWSERREAWSLDSDGRLHVRISTRGSDAAPSDGTLIYRRQ